jgi:Cu+-exporting ATPase
MIGDGLNDAGALREADCGLSVADEVYHFSPACDAILEARRFNRLPDFLHFSKTSRKIVIMSITLSFMYNIIGLSYAVTGHLAPIISAILMPLSSVSVILFITISIFLASLYYKLNSTHAD